MTRGAQPEAGIQHAVCEHLRLRAKPDVLWLHVPNGGLRNKREAVRFKRMGVLAGASDLLLWHRGNSFALELKSPGGRLSDAQFEFLARFNDAGGHSANAEGLDRALACLEAWGLLRGRSAGNEIAREHLRETAGWRHRLPDRRLSESFDIEIGGLEYTATVSRFSDGRIGEVFLGNHKSNSSADTAARDSAIVFSIAVQHGADPETIRRALCRDSQGRASGPLGAALDKIAGFNGGAS